MRVNTLTITDTNTNYTVPTITQLTIQVQSPTTVTDFNWDKGPEVAFTFILFAIGIAIFVAIPLAINEVLRRWKYEDELDE